MPRQRVVLKSGYLVKWEQHAWAYKVEEEVVGFFCVAHDWAHGGPVLGASGASDGFCDCWKGSVVEVSGDALKRLWEGRRYLSAQDLDEFVMRKDR